MKPAEKQAVMEAFSSNAIQLLVATTVIEVGVAVPTASLMVIEHAERMGLSQLHQLRGRVGRGTTKSTCLLLYQQPLTDTAQASLEILYDSRAGERRVGKEGVRTCGSGGSPYHAKNNVGRHAVETAHETE